MNVTDTGPALTLDELKAFEQEIGGRLSEDYRQFLLASNGGMIKPPVGFKWNKRINEVPGFDKLLPTAEIGLHRAIANLRELGVDGFLPVASTLNEEDICLAIRDEAGSVSLALYEYERDIPVGVTMVPLATSFTAFLDILIPIPEIHCPIEELGKHGVEENLAEYLAEGNLIDSIGKNDLPIICEAIKFNNRPMIEACIARGAGLSKTIHVAVVNQRTEMIEVLVNVGADVNEEDEFGDRPLYYVGGTALPGEEGAKNRELRDILIKLGAE